MNPKNPDAKAFRQADLLIEAAMSGASDPYLEIDVPRDVFMATRGLADLGDAQNPRWVEDLCIATSIAITQGWGEREGSAVIAARMDACMRVQSDAGRLLESAERHANGVQAHQFRWLIPGIDPKLPLSDVQRATINGTLSGISSSPERQASLLARWEGRFADLPVTERDEVLGQIGSAETTPRGIHVLEEFKTPAKVDPIVRYDELLRRSARASIAIAAWPRADIVDRLGLRDPDRDHPVYEDARLPYRRNALESTIMDALIMEDVSRDDGLLRVRNHRDTDPGTIDAKIQLIEEARRSFAQGVPPHLQPPGTRSEHPAPLAASASYSSQGACNMLVRAAREMDLWSHESLWHDQEASQRLLISEIEVALTIAGTANKFSFAEDRRSPRYVQAMAIGAQMKRGDFSRMEDNLTRVRKVASSMAPMLSNSTRELLGVGLPVERSVVHGIMVNARRGLEIDNMKDRRLDAVKGQAMAAMMAAARSR